GEARGAHPHAAFAPESAGNLQAASLVLERQPVAGLDLDGGDTFGDQLIEARGGARKQRLVAGRARGSHRGSDPSTASRDLLVTDALKAQLELGGALTTVDQVGMRVDEPGCDQCAFEVMLGLD